MGDYTRPKNAPLTFILVGINIIVFIVLEIMGSTLDSSFMLAHGVMNPYMVVHFGQWYRLFSCMFLHFGIEHLFNNMLLLFFLGQIFEQAVGTTRYAAIYLGSGLAGSFLSLIALSLQGKNDLVCGASGAIFGVVGGMILVILVHKGKYATITIKRMLFMAAITLYVGFTTAGTDNVGHVGGIIAGFILTFFLYGIPKLIKDFRSKEKSHDVDFEDKTNYTLDKSHDHEGE